MLKSLTTVSLALVSLFSSHKAVAEGKTSQDDSQNILKLNQISKGSIAASWVELPDSCKARMFNADPDIKDIKKHSAKVIQIFKDLA